MTYFVMAVCLDGNNGDIIRGEFDTLEQGVDWLRENHPGFFRPGIWESPDRGPEGPRQFGTDYYWACFEPLAGSRP